MNDDFETSAILIIVVFGALTLGGLIAAALTYGDRTAFLLAIGSSTLAWCAGYAMIFTKPNAFRWLLAATTLFAALSVIALVK